MHVIRSKDVQTLETPNGNFGASLATSSKGAHEVSVVRQRQVPGGFNPTHTHDREEVMVQLAGSVTLSSGDERIVLSAGDTVILPADMPHRLDNTGDTDAEWLIISAAGVRFFKETGEEAYPEWTK